MGAKSVFRVGLMVVCVGGTTLGLNNTYGDNSEVVANAQQVACGKPNCSYRLLRESRSAFSHEYAFQTELLAKGKPTASGTAEVVCKREFILLGGFLCTPKSSATP